jgi:2'-5' RNA ligase
MDSPSDADGAPLRLFFALWPDTSTVAGLAPWIARAHESCGGRPMRPEALHLTLAFLGTATARQAEELSTYTRAQRIEAGELTLIRYGSFRREGIIWAGPDPEALATRTLRSTQENLWQALQSLGWARPLETFQPHVTLLRKANVESLPAPRKPLTWRYDKYMLAASESATGGSIYRILASTR